MQNNAHQMRALAVAAVCDPRTATRWLAGLSVQSTTAERLARAAAKLGIPTPPASVGLAQPLPMAISSTPQVKA